jgi:hypothetical protein
VSFARGEGDAIVSRCSDLVMLVVPVEVTLELEGEQPSSFDASLSAMGPSHVAVSGRTPLFGQSTRVGLHVDAGDIELTLYERPDLPEPSRWTSLGSVESSVYLRELFPAIPGPLGAPGAAFTCEKETPAANKRPASMTPLLELLLTRVDATGCRTLGAGNVAVFRGEVAPAGTRSCCGTRSLPASA